MSYSRIENDAVETRESTWLRRNAYATVNYQPLGSANMPVGFHSDSLGHCSSQPGATRARRSTSLPRLVSTVNFQRHLHTHAVPTEGHQLRGRFLGGPLGRSFRLEYVQLFTFIYKTITLRYMTQVECTHIWGSRSKLACEAHRQHDPSPTPALCQPTHSTGASSPTQSLAPGRIAWPDGPRKTRGRRSLCEWFVEGFVLRMEMSGNEMRNEMQKSSSRGVLYNLLSL